MCPRCLFNLTFCLASFLSGYKCLWKHVYRDTVSGEHAATGAGMRSLDCTLIGCRKESDFCTQSPYLFASVPVPDTALTNTGLQARDWGLYECKQVMARAKMKLWSLFMRFFFFVKCINAGQLDYTLIKRRILYTLTTHCIRNTCIPGLSYSYVNSHSFVAVVQCRKIMQMQVMSFNLCSH